MRPDRISQAHPELKDHADAVSEQVQQLRAVSESLLREHRDEIAMRQFQQKRLYTAVSDILAQVAVLSRVTADLRGPGRRALGPGALHRRHLLQPRRRPRRAAPSAQIESNDDERMTAIAKLAYKRGEYGYALFED